MLCLGGGLVVEKGRKYSCRTSSRRGRLATVMTGSVSPMAAERTV